MASNSWKQNVQVIAFLAASMALGWVASEPVIAWWAEIRHEDAYSDATIEPAHVVTNTDQ